MIADKDKVSVKRVCAAFEAYIKLKQQIDRDPHLQKNMFAQASLESARGRFLAYEKRMAEQ